MRAMLSEAASAKTARGCRVISVGAEAVAMLRGRPRRNAVVDDLSKNLSSGLRHCEYKPSSPWRGGPPFSSTSHCHSSLSFRLS